MNPVDSNETLDQGSPNLTAWCAKCGYLVNNKDCAIFGCGAVDEEKPNDQADQQTTGGI